MLCLNEECCKGVVDWEFLWSLGGFGRQDFLSIFRFVYRRGDVILFWDRYFGCCKVGFVIYVG